MDLPEIFSGEEGKDFHQWIKRFELATEFIPNASEQRHILLPARLSGPAFIIWEGLSESDKKDFAKIKDKLSQVFGRTQYMQTFRSCITARKRLPNEPLEVYASAIITMVGEAFPKYDAEAKDGEAFRRFIAGVDQKLQVKIHEMGGTTLTDALNIALRVERANDQLSPTTSATVASTETKQDVVYLQLLKRLDELEKKFDKLNFTQDQSKAGDEQSRHPERFSSPRNDRPRSPSPRSRYSQHYEHRHRSPSPLPRYTSKDDYRQSHHHPPSSPQARYSPHYRQGQRSRSSSPRPEYRRRSPSPQHTRLYQHQRQPNEHFQYRYSHGYGEANDRYDNQPYSPRRSDRQPQDYALPSRHVQFADNRPENFH